MLQFKDRRLIKFGEHVAALRQKLGIEVKDVAAKCSLSIKDLLSIEQGNKNFGFTTLLELSKGLGVSPADLLDINFE
ncbi:helix-turn-helix domain-containing protein [Flavobacterium subsaxonicum]|uniref:HTH cro/C1-type domain-containing protein n=1 Tax=Flavobacterium subsaxonicum WB 4.1-42 = DSM 21790 TaxID=1121898 RepID=A0A0A2MEI1_9FLAO|nr:helix-turn-helix transcriptional regulator [Flavobacterium subsaxonicum]KGO91097.1 hypothetical protein Q766_19665 [Flavobacterium subsaxonicum WB 4.1-42 = DSM 21790]